VIPRLLLFKLQARVRSGGSSEASEHFVNDESGAVLLLALAFMVAASLLITGLTAWASNDIKNVGNFKTSRTAVYAAGGAIQTATWNLRYSYQATGSVFCPSSGSQPSTAPFTLDKVQIDVWCNITTNEGSSNSRVVTFSAYPASRCQATCTGKPYVQSQVTFNDFSSTNLHYCPPSGSQASTCGSAETVDSWVVQPSSS
jgi:hypothetical protein